MALTLIAPVTVPVVTLAQVKTWCRVEGSESDDLLDELLLAAQRHVEQIIGRSLGEQIWKLALDEFADGIELPKGPVTGIVAGGFQYRDEAGTMQVVDADIYSLDLVSVPARIALNDGESWPTLGGDVLNRVTIEFTAGYDAGQCPPDLAQAIKMLVAYWFDNRQTVNVGNIVNEMPFAVRQLTDPYRRIRI